jgi:type VI protein secretion system component VasK
VNLIDGLFSENVYQDAPIFRGAYFTSGTQEGRIIDRLSEGSGGRSASSPVGRAQPAVEASTSCQPLLRRSSQTGDRTSERGSARPGG